MSYQAARRPSCGVEKAFWWGWNQPGNFFLLQDQYSLEMIFIEGFRRRQIQLVSLMIQKTMKLVVSSPVMTQQLLLPKQTVAIILLSSTPLSNLKTSPRHDLAMIFTCKVCETRSVKTVCRESYEKGVVVARCGGCNNLHLIADRLGWFGEPGSIEDFLAARGEEVKKGSVDTLNLTLEDLAGNKILKE
ncbi:hypothetical protein GH714_033659 [Hevea brasiliensis]|uniref:DNL-type domain-containing protein n=1 Tax=Hevea brasiliensis TaxID=3981 RepID=A0A6A6L6I6_HEVBR|nr:hypothetical protein GH714_033659 [Hevea brasiliensis]